MKPGSREDYEKRIANVLACVQAAIEGGEDVPDLATLAGVAHFSPFHFHRIFRALTGEPLGRLVGRLRLAHALHLLGDPALDVTRAALAGGYASPQGFARAVKEALGTTPSQLVAEPGLRAGAIARLRRPAHRVPPDSPLQVEVVSMAPFEVVAAASLGRWDDLDEVYNALFEWAAAAQAVERIEGLYGSAVDDRRDVPLADFRFTAAIALADVDPVPPLQRETWGGGRYARLQHRGSFDTLDASVEALLAGWWPDSGEPLRDAPVLFHFLDDPEQVPEALLRTHVLVPMAT